MRVDENTPGSLANEEAVRVLKGWLFALYVVDCLVCVMGALGVQPPHPMNRAKECYSTVRN
jgi:hypothetical protein